MSITIGDVTVNYKTNGNKYITSFISDYPPELDTRIDQVFNRIFPLYNSGYLEYSNVCGPNSDYICKKVKLDGITFGKLIITFQQWRTPSDRADAIKIISDVYGSTVLSIGSTYHALACFEKTIDDKKYYVAIETTICEPYKLQFYVGTPEEFKTLLTARYQCTDFGITFECDKSWMNFMSGGRRSRRYRKSRKSRNTRKQHKNKRK